MTNTPRGIRNKNRLNPFFIRASFQSRTRMISRLSCLNPFFIRASFQSIHPFPGEE